MTTMESVKKYLLSNKWEEVELEADLARQYFKTTWGFPSGRAQVVWATLSDTFHQILSPFAREDELSADRALNMNQTILGVNKALGHYCLTAVGANSSFSPEAFEMLEQLVAQFADAIEENSGGGDVL
jgi:hypothetical protein